MANGSLTDHVDPDCEPARAFHFADAAQVVPDSDGARSRPSRDEDDL